MTAPRLCPICRRTLDESEETLRFRPFCSKRCADLDLGRWLRGDYAIPAAQADEADRGEGEPDEETPQVRH
jgi:endogenous inhibitor of DNA gyrase (YacG/DUF329 family)